MSIRDKLIKIVGAQNFSDKPEVLESYSKDYSIVPAGMPNYVAKPKTSEEVAKIVQLANKELIPVVPVSSAVHFNGGAIPKQGGVVVDMSRFNKILEIDELNKRVRLEAGVTWKQLIPELDKKGFRITMPLLPHPDRSVVMDYMEREVITNTVYDYGEPTQSFELVWPNGDIFRTGSASVTGYPDTPSKGANPSGPGLDFYRFVQGAQGTFGIVTWANLKIQHKTTVDKIYFAPINDLNYAQEFLYRILRIRIGQECVLLNATDMAAILAEDFERDFEKYRATLPPWTLVLVISGLWKHPAEKIKYEENAMKEILKTEFHEIKLTDSLPGFAGLNKKFMPILPAFPAGTDLLEE
jgi:FAD/FMN-containing dehydrogenase